MTRAPLVRSRGPLAFTAAELRPSPIWAPLSVAWILAALAVLVPVAVVLEAAFPIFTLIWLVGPLVEVARTGDASRIGFRQVPWRLLVRVTTVNVLLCFAVMLALEPWTHGYQRVVELAMTNQPIDSTFGWLVRFPRWPGLAFITLYSGLVTMFAEELCFRGWLLQSLRPRMGTPRAIVVQASLFLFPNLLVVPLLSPEESLGYLICVWLSVGLAGGWAAARTGSIWPSLISVTLTNLVAVAVLT